MSYRSLALDGGDAFVHALANGWESRTLAESRVIRQVTREARKSFSIAIDPRRRAVLTGTDGGAIHIDDLDDGAQRNVLSGHQGIVYALALHPAGRVLASGGEDGTIRLWDLEMGDEFVVLMGHDEYVHDLVFTPDGTTLVSGSGDGSIRLWSTTPLAQRAQAAGSKR